VSSPHFSVLTQQELTVDLSRPAMRYIVHALASYDVYVVDDATERELDNFRNTLLNLLERSEPGNLDLVGG
jgi:hypothetical protein